MEESLHPPLVLHKLSQVGLPRFSSRQHTYQRDPHPIQQSPKDHNPKLNSDISNKVHIYLTNSKCKLEWFIPVNRGVEFSPVAEFSCVVHCKLISLSCYLSASSWTVGNLFRKKSAWQLYREAKYTCSFNSPGSHDDSEAYSS